MHIAPNFSLKTTFNIDLECIRINESEKKGHNNPEENLSSIWEKKIGGKNEVRTSFCSSYFINKQSVGRRNKEPGRESQQIEEKRSYYIYLRRFRTTFHEIRSIGPRLCFV